MTCLRCVAFVLLAMAALAADAFAAETPECKGRDLSADPTVKPQWGAFADDLLNSEGLLWKMEKDGVAPSYLYGTIHSTQPDVVELARKAAIYVDGAKSVVTELGGPFDASTKVNMSSVMLSAALSPDRDTFANELSADEAALVERYLSARGYAPDFARHMKLWFLALAGALPSCEVEGQSQGIAEVDDTIAQIGKAKGVPVVALETIGEQVAAIAATPPELAAEILLATARLPDLNDDAYVTLLNLYRGKHPTRAIAVIDAAPGISDADRAAQKEFTKLLLVSRNEIMANRVAPELQAGGAFIAVGALHLSGKDGLVERFRKMNYRVTNLW